MKEKMVTMGVIGVVLLIGAIYMLNFSNGSVQTQIGGLVMLIVAIAALMEVRFLKVEMRLRKLEGKQTD